VQRLLTLPEVVFFGRNFHGHNHTPASKSKRLKLCPPDREGTRVGVCQHRILHVAKVTTFDDKSKAMPHLAHLTNGTGSHPRDEAQGTDSSIPPHPLGIKPLGNKYFFSGRDARLSLGALRALPEEMLVQLLEFLDQRSLRLLGYTCKFLFAHCVSDDLWKSLFLE